ncbi:MAG: energy transducer TonB [Saprospiraceae bacterium]|nr:energy transducer TonB [Saprospiraceae bacterium]
MSLMKSLRWLKKLPFSGMRRQGSMDEKKKCADEKMLQYLYKNIKYPNIAKENGVQGRCVVTFVVEKDGRITDAKVVRDIGGGCGEEALRVVNSMNEMGERWKPGKQRGNAVRVQFNLPVTFKLN